MGGRAAQEPERAALAALASGAAARGGRAAGDRRHDRGLHAGERVPLDAGVARAWRERGGRGVAEGIHPGAERHRTAERLLEARLEEGDPQAHGHAATNWTAPWTAPLLRSELAQQGWSASERTLRRAVRRTVQRLDYRWTRPQFVLGRPDPAYAEKKSRGRASGGDGGGRRRGVGRR